MNLPITSIKSTSPVEQQPPDILRRFDYALAREIRVPLGHINFAIELLEISVWNNDQKIYLDIINRNTTRINDLLKELLACQPANEIHATILICQRPGQEYSK